MAADLSQNIGTQADQWLVWNWGARNGIVIWYSSKGPTLFTTYCYWVTAATPTYSTMFVPIHWKQIIELEKKLAGFQDNMTRCLLLNLLHQSTVRATKPTCMTMAMLRTTALAIALAGHVFPPLVKDPWIEMTSYQSWHWLDKFLQNYHSDQIKILEEVICQGILGSALCLNNNSSLPEKHIKVKIKTNSSQGS